MAKHVVNSARWLTSTCRGKGGVSVTSQSALTKEEISIPVIDGASVKANLFRPKPSGGLAAADDAGTRFPVLVHAVPYGKDDTCRKGVLFDHWIFQYNLMKLVGNGNIGNVTLSEATPWDAIDPNVWCAKGYAVVAVDTRGHFASAPGNDGGGGICTPREAADYQAIVKWLATEAPWSSGKVASIGVSYLAISQWNMAGGRQKHDPAAGWGPKLPPVDPKYLTCMITWEGLASFERAGFTGGCTNNFFFGMWLGAAPKVGNPGGVLFNGQEAIATATAEMARKCGLYQSIESLAICEAEPEGIQVPVLTCQSWSDQGVHNPDGFEAWQRLTTASRYLYTHGRKKWDVFYNEAVPVCERFLDHYMKGAATSPWAGDKRVRIEVRETHAKCHVRYEDDFPLKATEPASLYLHMATKSLGLTPPTAETDAKSLVLGLHAGAPPLIFEYAFAEDTELTGYMALNMAAELQGGDDAEVYLRLEKLARDGSLVHFDGVMGDMHAGVAYGELRLSHHVSFGEADAGSKQRGPLQPWYTHKTRKALKAGEVVQVSIPVRPSSTLFRAGEKLRMIVSGDGSTTGPNIFTKRKISQKGKSLVLHGGRGAALLVPLVR